MDAFKSTVLVILRQSLRAYQRTMVKHVEGKGDLLFSCPAWASNPNQSTSSQKPKPFFKTLSSFQANHRPQQPYQSQWHLYQRRSTQLQKLYDPPRAIGLPLLLQLRLHLFNSIVVKPQPTTQVHSRNETLQIHQNGENTQAKDPNCLIACFNTSWPVHLVV